MKIEEGNLNIKIPIVKLGLNNDQIDFYINKISDYGDEMDSVTNLKAKMSSFDLHQRDKDFAKLSYKIAEKIEENFIWKQHGPERYKCLFLHDFWFGCYNEGDFAVPHDHLPGFISFVYYIQTNESKQPLCFNELDLKITPEKDDIIFFPSYLVHQVPKQSKKTKKDRIVFAGNLILPAPAW